MAPIRVLHIITRLIVGGAQENTMFTAALLDKRRFQVDVLSGPQTGSEGSLINEVRAWDIPLTILPEMLREVSPKNDILAIWKLNQIMRRGRYSIVHTHSSKAGILGRIAAKMAGIPVIVHTVHGWSFHEHMSPGLRNTYIFLERFTASFSDALIAVAEKDIQKGLTVGIGKPGQYHLIRSAIPLNEFNPAQTDQIAIRQELGLPLDAPVLGNVGRFSAQKNPFEWVRVAGEVGRQMPEARFLLVGDGPLRAQVEEQLASEGIAERIILPGLRRDVGRMMSAMDVFLLTSLWEGLPRVLPQAMAMGLPVVAQVADGTAEAVQNGETGFLCPPGETTQLAGHCIYLLGHPEESREMGARGRQIAVQQFDLQTMVERISDLYENLLATRPSLQK